MEIKEIKVAECTPFKDNPFKVKQDLEMEMLIDSIKLNGVLVPIVVRPQKENGYEIISGHRRVYACKEAGIETVPAFIREMSRDESVIFMVDSNIQREHLLSSEKAFAYRMRLEAMKKQGFRTDLTSDQAGQKLQSVERLAQQTPDSKTQVQRYIRLTNLEKPLLDLVDEGRIAFTPAVELSYLLPEEQQMVITFFQSDEVTPSYSQSVRMRKLSEQGLLTEDKVFEIMTEVKGNQKEYLKLPTERYDRYLKRFHTPKEKEDFIEKALAHYSRFLERQRDAR